MAENDRRSPKIAAATAIATLAAVLGVAIAGPSRAQAPTTATTTAAVAEIDMIDIQGGGTPCREPMPAQLFIRWLNGVPPQEWSDDVFPSNVETVTIDNATVTTDDGTTTLSFSPSNVLDPSDPGAQIDSSEFFVPALPGSVPTYEIVYTVAYADGTTDTYAYSRDVGIAVPAIGCPVPGPPTSEVVPTTVPGDRGDAPAPGATPIPSSPSYTG